MFILIFVVCVLVEIFIYCILELNKNVICGGIREVFSGISIIIDIIFGLCIFVVAMITCNPICSLQEFKDMENKIQIEQDILDQLVDDRKSNNDDKNYQALLYVQADNISSAIEEYNEEVADYNEVQTCKYLFYFGGEDKLEKMTNETLEHYVLGGY